MRRASVGVGIAAHLIASSARAQVVSNPASEEPADAVRWTWLDYARRVPRAYSASRDTPRLELSPMPRALVSAGGEFALVHLRGHDWGLRMGFAGLLELDSEGQTQGVNSGPFPSGRGLILWRGSFSYYVGADWDALGRHLCGSCVLEAVVAYRHESEHYTGSNYGGGGRDFLRQPYVGDDLELEVALEASSPHWYLTARLAGMAFLPERSSYLAGGAADLHLRWIGWDTVHPFASLYGQYLLGHVIRDRAFPDAYRAQLMWGVSLPSDLGDVMLFGTGTVGHRYGLQALAEEATLGLGVRLALGRSWVPSSRRFPNRMGFESDR